MAHYTYTLRCEATRNNMYDTWEIEESGDFATFEDAEAAAIEDGEAATSPESNSCYADTCTIDLVDPDTERGETIEVSASSGVTISEWSHNV